MSLLKRLGSAVAIGTLALAPLTACGASGGSGGQSGSSPLDQAAQAQVQTLYNGSSKPPPTTSPKPKTGQSVWVISAAQSVQTVALEAQGVQQAGQALGWHVNLFDGQGSPNLWLSGIQQAVAAHANGIVLAAIDCSSVVNGLRQAKQAGIPVVGIESQDCSPSLESVITYADGAYNQFARKIGTDSALWLMSKNSKSATFIETRETDSAVTLAGSAGFEAAIKQYCPGCKNIVVNFTIADLGPGLQQKVQQTLLRNPGADGLFVPYDDVALSSTSAAVVAGGRANNLDVMSVGGTPAIYSQIRQNHGVTADLVYNLNWEGWSAVDWINRLMNGQQPDPVADSSGIGFQIVDKTHNLPTGGTLTSNVNFESLYKKAWGVGQ